MIDLKKLQTENSLITKLLYNILPEIYGAVSIKDFLESKEHILKDSFIYFSNIHICPQEKKYRIFDITDEIDNCNCGYGIKQKLEYNNKHEIVLVSYQKENDEIVIMKVSSFNHPSAKKDEITYLERMVCLNPV
ncbi:MAG: hypothetical protein WC755_02245 [Candidatus Woesearchaeota archaeon]